MRRALIPRAYLPPPLGRFHLAFAAVSSSRRNQTAGGWVIPPINGGDQKWNFPIKEFCRMKRSRFTTSQIIEAIERAEAGLDVSGLCWAPGVSFGHVLPMARPKYGGIDVSLLS